MQVRCWPESLVSPTKGHELFWGHLKTRVNFRLEFTRFQRIFYAYKPKRSPTEKKVGPPKKNQWWPLEKESSNESFLTYFPGFPRALDWRFCSTRPDWISLDTNFGLEIRTCYSTASSHSRAQSNHQLFRLNVIFCMIYCTTLIVFSIASLVFSINYNLFFSISWDSYQKMTAS